MNEPKLEIRGEGVRYSLYIDGEFYMSFPTWEEASREKERLLQGYKEKLQRELMQENIKRQNAHRRFKP